MDQVNKKWVILGAVVLVILWLISSVIGAYNKLVNLETDIQGKWAQVETQLQRRGDLIPNLVNVVKSYAKHEKEVFTNIADARAKLAGAKTVSDKVKAQNDMSGALSRLLMVVENYPTLLSNKNFLSLQDQLEGTENRIATERKRYNESVQEYNRIRKSFPMVMLFKEQFEKEKPFFKAAAGTDKVPEVKMD